jgi:hypothetical protein
MRFLGGSRQPSPTESQQDARRKPQRSPNILGRASQENRFGSPGRRWPARGASGFQRISCSE